MAALVHTQKTLHYLSASRNYLGSVYEVFTAMCEEQTYTDLTLVTSDGKAFGVHKVVLVGCSPVVRSVLADEGGCRCEKPTVYLPDFSSYVVKSLLCLLYTGQCESECSLDELRPLAKTLKINIRNVGVSAGGTAFNGGGPMGAAAVTVDSFQQQQQQQQQQDSDCAIVAGEEDEVMEVTPEVHRDFFTGKHFLLTGNDDRDRSDEDSISAVPDMMAGGTNGHDQVAGDGFSTSGVGYLCRLCGRTTPSPASLFSHLLYPHYAHLWKDEIPQRKQKYDCKECDYTTKNRQRFVMHVARVHDDLRRKLTELGENLEVLANTSYNTRCATPGTSKIVSRVAKMRAAGDEDEFPSGGGAELAHHHHADGSAAAATAPPPTPRGGHGAPKLVRCRVCGSWKRRENFFTHMVSVHFRHLWDNDLPKTASLFKCSVPNCNYSTKYRYNMLFHLGGRHKQLRDKIRAEGYDEEILNPLEPEEVSGAGVMGLGDSPFQPRNIDHFRRGGPGNLMMAGGVVRMPRKYRRHNEIDPSKKSKKLQCKMCGKIAHNHASHRLHVVSKHFSNFWAQVKSDDYGVFTCHHSGCEYRSSNRQVFVIHQAFVHSELKIKLVESGQDPSLGEPLGKRNSSILMSPEAMSSLIKTESGSSGTSATGSASAAAATTAGTAAASSSAELPKTNGDSEESNDVSQVFHNDPLLETKEEEEEVEDDEEEDVTYYEGEDEPVEDEEEEEEEFIE